MRDLCFNRTIQCSPNEGELSENEEKLLKLFLKRYSKIKDAKVKFSLGQLVRISKSESKFKRSYHTQMQEEPFTIDSIDDRLKIPLYEIRSLFDNERIIGSFMNHELTSMDVESKFSFKKVIRKKNDGKLSLISFHGLPENFNQWIPSQELSEIIANGNKPIFSPLLKYINDDVHE